MIKILLLDVDGVLINDTDIFSYEFEKEFNLDDKILRDFFHNEFQDCILGKKDIKSVLKNFLQKNNLNISYEDFVNKWYESENKPNSLLIHFIHFLKNVNPNIKIILATNNDSYRMDYILNNMNFKDFIDEYYCSSKLGLTKPNPDFFRVIHSSLNEKIPNLKKEEILFFDDSIYNVESAKQLGFNSHHYNSFDEFLEVLKLNNFF